MQSYILNVLQTEKKHAGSKAQDDVAYFLHQKGFMNVYIDGELNRIERFLFFKHDFRKKVVNLSSNDRLLIQYPFYLGKHVLKVLPQILKQQKVHSIVLVHDIPSLRNLATKSVIKTEITWLNQFETLIVHTNRMKDWLLHNGCKTQIIVLNIFDYYIDPSVMLEVDTAARLKDKDFPQVIFAGNIGKSLFIREIHPKNYKLNLFGIGDDNINRDNINHFGSFPPSTLPRHLVGDFGLVWDGDSTEQASDYLKYNSPHKLSLYIACGIPVIVWKKSASAEFVKNHHMGFVIDSLDELDDLLKSLSNEQYSKIKKAVELISVQLRSGYYTKLAVENIGDSIK